MKRKWAVPVIRILEPGPMRYTDIQHDLIVASQENLHAHTLTDTLEWLKDRRYIEKHREARTADYRLTDIGEQLARIVCDIEDMISRIDLADCERDS